MAKTRHFLVTGMALAAVANDRVSFEVRPGRWDPGLPNGEGECAVIVQERRRGPLKSSGVFKMAVELEAIPTIIEGLMKWLEWDEAGKLGELFPGGGPQSGKSPG